MTSFLPDSEYADFFANAQFRGIVNPLSLAVRVDPIENGGANVLNFYTGTVEVGTLFSSAFEPLQQSTEEWSRGSFEFKLPTPGFRWTFQPESPTPSHLEPNSFSFVHKATVVLSLASIFNEGVSNSAGWAVDGANIEALGNEDEGLQVQAKLAIRDTDGHLYRLAYQATVLGQAPDIRHASTGPITVGPSIQ